MMTIVEFTGLTCAGKTTLLEAVAEELSDQGLFTRDAYDVVLGRYARRLAPHPTLRLVAIHLVALLPFLRYIWTRKGFELLILAIRVISHDAGGFRVALNLGRNFAKRIGVYVMLMGLVRQSGDSDFVVWDEGTLHLAHNLFVHPNSEPDLSEIVHFSNIVPRPDIIVWVKGTKEQSIECILQRGHARVKASTNAVQAFVEHGELTFNVLCAQDSVQENLFTIENRATDRLFSIQDRAQTVAAFLMQNRVASDAHA